MPTYLYECKTCGSSFEVEQKMTDPALTTCGCGRNEPVRRLIQPTAILFKGSGFHVNDYPSSSSSSAKSADRGDRTPACDRPGCGCPLPEA